MCVCVEGGGGEGVGDEYTFRGRQLYQISICLPSENGSALNENYSLRMGANSKFLPVIDSRSVFNRALCKAKQTGS